MSARDRLDRYVETLQQMAAGDADRTAGQQKADASARGHFIAALVAEVRREALREAADAVAPDAFGYGGPDHEDAWTAAEEKLRRMADEAEGGAA